MKCFTEISTGPILFLTNNENTDAFFQRLKADEGNVLRYEGRLTPELLSKLCPRFVISFNYKYIVPGEIILMLDSRIINLHISFLPYNKGSAPNFFSFYDNTPKGVTIHRMSAGLDTGDILLQKELFFDESVETFASTYDTLIKEMTELFFSHRTELLTNRIPAMEQPPALGTKHTMKELNAIRTEYPFTWNETISVVKARMNR